MPSLELGPEALNLVAVYGAPVRAGHRRLLVLHRDRELGAEVADVAAKGVAGIATFDHDPSW